MTTHIEREREESGNWYNESIPRAVIEEEESVERGGITY